MPLESRQKRSQSIKLVLLGTATLLSGCASLQQISEPTLYLSEGECIDVWLDPLKCGYVLGTDELGTERVYWFYKGDMSQEDLTGTNALVSRQPFLRRIVREVTHGLTHVIRRGFGGSARHFGGAFA
jgi:hypothetical protein